MTEQRAYADFDLLIEKTGEGYRARVLESPAGGATGSFMLPFSELELELFLLKVGRPRRGTRRLESPEMGAAREFGGKLYDALFHDELKLSLHRSRDEVERRDEGLRIRLRFTDAPELASLPWEFLYDASDDQFLVLSAWTPIVRYLDLSQRIEPLTVMGPLRILTMISSPHDFPSLDVDEEWRRIGIALQSLIDQGSVVIERTDDATLLDLQRRLRRSEYHVFHFVGHGGFDERAGDGLLVMEDGNNRSRSVAGRDLATILNDHRDLRMVVLNACEGARSSNLDPFSGVAQSMVRKGIPAVVAMQFEITDDAAIAFSQEFYGAIADSYSVDAAIGEARRAIFGLGNDIEWGTPVVYMRGDGRLFEIQGTPTPVAEGGSHPAATTGVIGKEAVEEVETPPRASADEPSKEVDRGQVEATPSSAEKVADKELLSELTPQSVGEEVDEGLVEAAPSSAEKVADGELPGLTSTSTREEVVGQAPSSVGERQLTKFPIGLKASLAVLAVAAIVVLALGFLAGEGVIADGEAVAQRTDRPVVIDGLSDDWRNMFFHTTDHVIYHWAEVRADPSARGGEKNTSKIQLAWDDTYLYVFAEVEDDVVAVPETGDQIWQNDAVTLNISVISSDGVVSETADDDDHQLTLDANAASAHYVIGGRALSLNFADVVTAPGTSSGYTLEARLPWAEIGVTSPQSGDRFGLLLAVFDNDNDFPQADIMANTAPGGDTLDNRWFRGPRTWGELTLEG